MIALWALAMTTTAIPSPCTQDCLYSEADGFCSGCGRTLEEIALWGGASDAQKSVIAAALPERLARRAPVTTVIEIFSPSR
jgi:uncharacterized protein